MKYALTPKTRKELMEFVGYKGEEYFRKNILKPLIEKGKLFLTIPDKPTSRNQKYVSKMKKKK